MKQKAYPIWFSGLSDNRFGILWTWLYSCILLRVHSIRTSLISVTFIKPFAINKDLSQPLKKHIFLTWTQSRTPVEISLCYFNNFNHPQRDQPNLFRMKYVITVMNISIGLTQCGLIWGLRTDDFIMKLINLLIRELDNCSLGGDFWVLISFL